MTTITRKAVEGLLPACALSIPAFLVVGVRMSNVLIATRAEHLEAGVGSAMLMVSLSPGLIGAIHDIEVILSLVSEVSLAVVVSLAVHARLLAGAYRRLRAHDSRAQHVLAPR
ncbi:hypothetical protein GUJ93_ZPchr0001g30505 [Zizania palustris]|uniref:Uncharacterized protein n=1 Tax=Zizania palustris TaxID=103762 RepID=A0A8J5RPF1_ZIZPA|nr:hypothetical protein GUJ93_ZPchr0001g30505 [Zizania palustris]